MTDPDKKPYVPGVFMRWIGVPIISPIVNLYALHAGIGRRGKRATPVEWADVDWFVMIAYFAIVFFCYYCLYIPYCRSRLKNWEEQQEWTEQGEHKRQHGNSSYESE